ncbi:MAG TPA: diacylglycerol kinase family protein [Verrucomicrobiae bacterium]|nr:diacylglycerol kinase family protein [Verrucomicrobiae bacterium]
MSVCIIFNPTARGNKARRFQAELAKVRADWALKPTHCAGAARQMARDAVESGFETIIAAGGDGTINEVLNGIGDARDGFKRARLGVLPLGTINVFSRELRIPMKIAEAWPILERGHDLTVDIGCAEFQNGAGPETRYFLQMAGAGLDGRAVELVDWELKKKFGPGAYVVAALKALGSEQPRITIRNGKIGEAAQWVLIGNGRFYGGSYPVFHKGDLQDGVLDAVLFEKMDWARLPGHLWSFVSGRMFRGGASTYLQGQEFILESDRRAALQLDGEAAGELPARITVLPKALRVIAPRLPPKRAAESSDSKVIRERAA